MCLLLFPTITTGCKTTQKTETRVIYVLPPKPQRKEIKAPKTIQDYALIVNYYEHLVQEWEQWGESVEKIIYAEKREAPVEK
mgnify:CR=1 FL=1